MMPLARRQLLVTTAAIASTLAVPVRAAEPIRIGDINSYTRMAAFTGPYLEGMQLGLTQVNARGGIDGPAARAGEPRRRRRARRGRAHRRRDAGT